MFASRPLVTHASLSFPFPPTQLPKMGCGKSTAVVPKLLTAEEKAVAQLKFLFESIDMDSDKTVDRKELQAALQKNAQLQALIAEANLNPDSAVLQQFDTNKDGRVSWEEFESHLKKAAITQTEENGCVAAAEVIVGEKAKASLKEVFKLIDSNKDNTVDKDELATKFRAGEGEALKTLFAEAGLKTSSEVLEQLGADSDKRVTWDKFYDKLKEAAEAEVRAAGDVRAAMEITATNVANDVKIEDTVKSTCCC